MNNVNSECRVGVIDKFLNGELSKQECETLELHLSKCKTCNETLTKQTASKELWDDAKSLLSDCSDQHLLPCAVDPSIDQQNAQDNEAFDDTNQWLDATDHPRMIGRFGGYEIAGVVGRGGMGVVLKGLDLSLDRYVAIKVLNPAFGNSSAARQRFAREAQAAAAVVHDNVIAIHGVDRWNGLPYLVMPYVNGESLQQRIDRCAPLSIESTLEIGLQIARGLAAAHDQGLIHRDIKPANILVPSSVSRVLITDFGLARTVDDASLTRTGVIAGTPQYMSPEQARGETIDARTDQFSLGCVLYTMICGHPPFRATSTFAILRRITDDPHRPLSEIMPSTPRWFGDIVDRMLEKDPSKRFDSMASLADHLEDCLAHLRQPSTVVLPKLDATEQSRFGSHRKALFWTLGIALLLLSGLFGRNLFDRNLDTTRQSASQSTKSITEPLLQWEYEDAQLTELENELNELSNFYLPDPLASKGSNDENP